MSGFKAGDHLVVVDDSGQDSQRSVQLKVGDVYVAEKVTYHGWPVFCGYSWLPHRFKKTELTEIDELKQRLAEAESEMERYQCEARESAAENGKYIRLRRDAETRLATLVADLSDMAAEWETAPDGIGPAKELRRAIKNWEG